MAEPFDALGHTFLYNDRFCHRVFEFGLTACASALAAPFALLGLVGHPGKNKSAHDIVLKEFFAEHLLQLCNGI